MTAAAEPLRALVTGANGFVGAHLVAELLTRGYRVKALVRKTSDVTNIKHDAVELVFGDVTAMDALTVAMNGVDVVFHLAGITKAYASAEFNRVNVQGTANVMTAAATRDEGPPRVVHVSSIAAAGPCASDVASSESDACHPVSRYGESKAQGEVRVRALADRVPSSIVRPPIVYGPRDRDVFELFKMAAGGWVVQAGFTPRRFSIVHVHDLVRGLCLVAERGQTLSQTDLSRGVYYIADDGPYLWGELGKAAASGFGRSARVVRVPDAVTFGAAYFGELIGKIRKKPFVLNLDKAREGTAGHWYCSSDRARNELGFAILHPLATGFAETAHWYKENGWV
ncbi:MAG: NAD-dependent epimerase/dehydratase family protein [Clostridia bacterium]|nr:NAD-dependent epimerase/dehydratase family protein [Deltaproteobacteria bacterium]